MKRIVARVVTGLLLVGAVWFLLQSQYFFALWMVMMAAAGPVGRWIARHDATIRDGGGGDQSPPVSGIGGHPWS